MHQDDAGPALPDRPGEPPQTRRVPITPWAKIASEVKEEMAAHDDGTPGAADMPTIAFALDGARILAFAIAPHVDKAEGLTAAMHFRLGYGCNTIGFAADATITDVEGEFAGPPRAEDLAAMREILEGLEAAGANGEILILTCDEAGRIASGNLPYSNRGGRIEWHEPTHHVDAGPGGTKIHGGFLADQLRAIMAETPMRLRPEVTAEARSRGIGPEEEEFTPRAACRAQLMKAGYTVIDSVDQQGKHPFDDTPEEPPPCPVARP